MSSRRHGGHGARTSSGFPSKRTAVSSSQLSFSQVSSSQASYSQLSSSQVSSSRAGESHRSRPRSSAYPGGRADDAYYVEYCGRCEAVVPSPDHVCVPKAAVPPAPPAASRRGASTLSTSSISAGPDRGDAMFYHSATSRATLPPGTDVFDYQDNRIPDDVFYAGPAPGPHAAYRVGDPGTQDSLDGSWPRAVSEYSRYETGPSRQQPASHRNPAPSYYPSRQQPGFQYDPPPPYYTGSNVAASSGYAADEDEPSSYPSSSSAGPPRYITAEQAAEYSDGPSGSFLSSGYDSIDFEPVPGEYYPPSAPSTFSDARSRVAPSLQGVRRHHTRSRPPVAYRSPPPSSSARRSSSSAHPSSSSAHRTSSSRRHGPASSCTSGTIDSLRRQKSTRHAPSSSRTSGTIDSLRRQKSTRHAPSDRDYR